MIAIAVFLGVAWFIAVFDFDGFNPRPILTMQPLEMIVFTLIMIAVALMAHELVDADQ